MSATIGEGHDAAGRALKEAITRAWPDCQVGWLDTLDTLGPGIAAAARASYAAQVQRTPAVYDFLFSATGRFRWPLVRTRNAIGSWVGRRMAPHIRGFDPDVIISTYPLGSAGLSWLRRHRGLGVPAGAWVPAFFPHPYWLYSNLDVTYVMHPDLVPMASQAEPGTRVHVGARPVRDVFTPGDRDAARCRLGLDPSRFVTVICTGSLGFGRLDDVVTAVLAAGPDVQAVVICGQNERLRSQLTARAEPPARLRVVGWTDDMPGWMTAADVVVANAGGATALEAMACAVPLIMFDPIAGHGRANAEHMAAAGVALLPRSPSELTAAIARLAAAPVARAGLHRTVAAGRGNRRRKTTWLSSPRCPGAIRICSSRSGRGTRCSPTCTRKAFRSRSVRSSG